LSGKAAIVTGAGGRRGIGRAIALRLAREGADVAVVDKSEILSQDAEQDNSWKGISSVAAEIQALGRRGIAIVCDISRSEDVDAMVTETISKLGKIDILVNNAGVHIYAGIKDITNEVWDKHLAVNLTGTFYCSRAVVREMVARGAGGRIINIASVQGKTGVGDRQLAYSVSKFGVIGMTQCLALELAADKILVNSVCPTLTDTDLHYDAFKASAERQGTNIQEPRKRLNEIILNRVPLGRLGMPEDIASMVAFLASDEAVFITGQSINVNGGQFTAM
jgi:NAD(P)-dependent dehydrogenase (short-subunit alcohol dehydrogenase family)